MSPELIGLLSLVLLFALIALHVPIGAAMAVAGVLGVCALLGPGPALALIPIEGWFSFANPELALVILFVLMGNLATLARLPVDFYRLAAAWLGHRRGGLATTTVVASGGFGAICGSSIATTATMARMALPEMKDAGYGDRLAAGVLAAGATLGIIVPPSIVLVLYGLLTEQPVGALFRAALVPAGLALLFHALTVAWISHRNPELAPAAPRADTEERLQRLRDARAFLGLVLLLGLGFYGGLLTLSETAALGVVLALIIAVVRRRAGITELRETLTDTAATSAMIYLVIVGAAVFSYAMTLSGLPETLVRTLSELALPPLMIILLLQLMYILLGSVFDTVAAMVITLPFVFPLVTGLGYDPIWWGIVNVVVMEIGMITPPIGLNVYVLHGVAPALSLGTIFRGVLPFALADLLRLLLLTLVPALALAL